MGGDACVCTVGRWGYRDRAGSGLFWWCGGVLRALLSRSPSSPSGSSLELRWVVSAAEGCPCVRPQAK